jgi:hypothetical protein
MQHAERKTRSKQTFECSRERIREKADHGGGIIGGEAIGVVSSQVKNPRFRLLRTNLDATENQ